MIGFVIAKDCKQPEPRNRINYDIPINGIQQSYEKKNKKYFYYFL